MPWNSSQVTDLSELPMILYEDTALYEDTLLYWTRECTSTKSNDVWISGNARRCNGISPCCYM